MNLLKQSTAATIKLGPFVDDTDGKTAETALTIGQADIRLSKNGGDIAQTNNSTGATHDELGYYNVPLDATDTGTLGRLLVAVHKSGALPVWQEFLVVTANVYDTLCSTDKLDVAVVEMATDVLTAASVKADAVTKIQNGLATPTNITAGTITTVTNLTNLPTMPTDWLTAAGLKADAVTKIQSGLALEATLTAIKGAGWNDETLVALKTAIEAVTGGSGATAQEVWEYATRVLTAGTNLPTAAQIAQEVWHKPTVDGMSNGVDSIGYDLLTAADAIKAKTDLIPASPAEAGEYTAAIGAIPTAPLLAANYTAPDNAGIAAVKAKTDNLPANPADDSDIDAQLAAIKSVIDNIHDTDLPAVKAETALIVEDTGTTIPATLATIAGYTDGIAGDVWSYAKRTLTHPSVSAEVPEDSNTLVLYRDADIAIELTDLTIPAGAKKYIFTIKDNLDSGDDQAVLQASYAIDGSEVETNTLVYINSAVPPALTNPVTFTLTETNITIDLTAEAAALLPRYERGYLNWDLKLVTDAAVTIVLQGLAQIIGTSTRAIE